jgi:hypothetical protein
VRADAKGRGKPDLVRLSRVRPQGAIRDHCCRPSPLLRLPAVGDIAAKQTAPPKRKRRWFQFSLRSLMIVVTLFCVFVRFTGYVVRRAQTLKREREQAVIQFRANVYGSLAKLENGRWVPDPRTAPWPLSWFEGGITRLQLPEDATEESIQRMREFFPEATITKRSGPQPPNAAVIP